MNSLSYRAVWKNDFQRRREGLIKISTWDPYGNWELNTMPDSSTEHFLLYGLDILYGHGDACLARLFLEYCLAIAERTLAEDKLQSPRCRDTFPENRGILLSARTYAQAVLGSPLDAVALRQAAADFEQACADFRKHKWDDFQENTYLSAVRVALVAGDAETVQRLLTRRRVFRWFPEQDELFRGLLPLLQTSTAPDADFQARFKAYFDCVRDPNYKPQMQVRTGIYDVYVRRGVLRLEMGILYEKYFLSPDRTINWQRTIDAIAD